MPAIRLLFLWHMHQPFYKDLVTGEYRLPWVRLHALKDYYGMVKLLDEFPAVHQTFNLVPSLIAQIQDYVSGAARDPFLTLAAKPAADLDSRERQLAIQYLFQANVANTIGRYPRYHQLWQEFGRHREGTDRLAARISNAEITDLQVLSQIGWMDEFFLDEPPIRELIEKGRDYSLEDQEVVIAKEKEFLARVLPAYKEAFRRGGIEISTSPYYHPILPLVCDTNVGAVSHPGLPLPKARFQHPEDAREQIQRGVVLHESVFGQRPQGMWPSEGSVSDEVLSTAHALGLQWLATDEGVLGRSLGTSFTRDGAGCLEPAGAEKLYKIYRWERAGAAINVIFRDHTLSDLIGFVYSGAPPADAVHDFIRRIKKSAQPILDRGRSAVVPVILDGENAWESYPRSGREFLRRLYDAIRQDSMFEALTVSEAVDLEPPPATLASIFPGSWINANFDVWIGAPEDNLAWDHLSAARDFFAEHAAEAPDEKKDLAYEELLIAEGSDWNWWYGPEHHSANDPDFDDLYRKHLANVYHALNAAPPHALAEPIGAVRGRTRFTPQTAHIHPLIDGKDIGYFDWLGAATHVANQHSSAMHGQVFLLDTGYAGVDDENLYCRLDFTEPPAEWANADTRLVLTVEPVSEGQGRTILRLESDISGGRLQDWTLIKNGHGKSDSSEPANNRVAVAMDSIFECQIPLSLLGAPQGSLLHVRFSLWRGALPLDSLPKEGSIDVRVVSDTELSAVPYAKP
jgi:alpha-amylase/alpha-mannosidase (GH57 family)